LAAYGSTNKYRPVKKRNPSGNTADSPTQAVYFFCSTATRLTVTASVKIVDVQRCVHRIALGQFKRASFDDQLKQTGHAWKYFVTSFSKRILLPVR